MAKNSVKLPRHKRNIFSYVLLLRAILLGGFFAFVYIASERYYALIYSLVLSALCIGLYAKLRNPKFRARDTGMELFATVGILFFYLAPYFWGNSRGKVMVIAMFGVMLAVGLMTYGSRISDWWYTRS